MSRHVNLKASSTSGEEDMATSTRNALLSFYLLNANHLDGQELITLEMDERVYL